MCFIVDFYVLVWICILIIGLVFVSLILGIVFGTCFDILFWWAFVLDVLICWLGFVIAACWFVVILRSLIRGFVV